MVSEGNGLILQQRVTQQDPATLHCREITLRLSADCRHLVLSRYTEHYGPAQVRCIERSHTVSVRAVSLAGGQWRDGCNDGGQRAVALTVRFEPVAFH